MSKDKPATDKPAKGGRKGMLMMIIVAIIMLGVGGGGAFALVKVGVIGGEKKKQDNSPKLLRKGDDDPYAPKVEAGKDGGGPEVEGDGGSPYKTSYYNFTDDFTSNLRDSTSLIQVSLACSTQHDGRVLMWLKKHELAERSAMLAVLADTPETDVNTITGKEVLQKRLAAAINHILVQKEGFGGVDDVYFKSFLVQ